MWESVTRREERVPGIVCSKALRRQGPLKKYRFFWEEGVCGEWGVSDGILPQALKAVLGNWDCIHKATRGAPERP